MFLTLDPGSGMEKFGSGMFIPDPQHCFILTLIWRGINILAWCYSAITLFLYVVSIYSQWDWSRILLGVPVFFGKGKVGKGTYPTLFIPVWIGIVLMPILSQVLHLLEIHRTFSLTFIHSSASLQCFIFLVKVKSAILIIIFGSIWKFSWCRSDRIRIHSTDIFQIKIMLLSKRFMFLAVIISASSDPLSLFLAILAR